MIRDSRDGYGIVTILFHWVSAILVLGLFGLGLYMTSLSYYDTWYHKGPWWHVSFGLLLCLLTVVRLLWRATNQEPSPLREHALSNSVARVVKWLLYALMLTVIISGYLINTAQGQSASFFDWFAIPSLLEVDPTWVDRLGEIHLWGAWLIIGLVVLHVGGALLHHFIWRDRTLVRMLKPAADSALNK